MDVWDPIGVKGVPQAHDEYDRYAIEVTSMLLSQRTKDEIADYLHQIANEWMGLQTGRERSQNVASELFDIYSSSKTRKGLN
jgi:hypothetical protein